ncbi:MAG: GntR family transcriptional regulator [Thermoleophilia bacterium]|nr:GntR family transcriptional regulator [Thermoleophilia bacterium]
MDEAYTFDLERGSTPLYLAIAEQLTGAIASGRLAKGTRLPPERQFAESLAVSRMTVRQALGELERAGLLRRVVGRSGGTFVREPVVRRDAIQAIGLSAALRREANAAHVELISTEIESAGKRGSAVLGVGQDDDVVVIVRLRLVKGKPFAVERSSLPLGLFPGIEKMNLAGSLYGLMDVEFGLRPVRMVERLETAGARPSDSRTMGVKRGAPMILVERIGYSADGTAVEFARDRFRGDSAFLVVESNRVEG